MSVLERDFFTDQEVLRDPAPYYIALREHGPSVVHRRSWRLPCGQELAGGMMSL